MQKVLQKEPNESILKMAKIGHDPKAIAFAKWSFRLKKLEIPKRCKKRLYEHITIVGGKKPLQRTPNIRKLTEL